jgi:hypothetical protein
LIIVIRKDPNFFVGPGYGAGARGFGSGSGSLTGLKHKQKPQTNLAIYQFSPFKDIKSQFSQNIVV